MFENMFFSLVYNFNSSDSTQFSKLNNKNYTTSAVIQTKQEIQIKKTTENLFNKDTLYQIHHFIKYYYYLCLYGRFPFMLHVNMNVFTVTFPEVKTIQFGIYRIVFI